MYTNKLLICDKCQINKPLFDQAYVIFSYEQAIKSLLLSLKFNRRLVNGQILGKILKKYVLEIWYKNKTLPNAIIPVPLHIKRLRERGFNQAMELARHLSKFISIDNSLITKIKNTKAQALLSGKKRI